jgi:hypothetical protein
VEDFIAAPAAPVLQRDSDGLQPCGDGRGSVPQRSVSCNDFALFSNLLFQILIE